LARLEPSQPSMPSSRRRAGMLDAPLICEAK
jgi:hypothetical protein